MRRGRKRGKGKGQKRGRAKKEKRKKEEGRIVSWNCAGLRKKKVRFLEYLRRFDVTVLTETWMEGSEGEVEGMRRKLKGYKIEFKKAIKIVQTYMREKKRKN